MARAHARATPSARAGAALAWVVSALSTCALTASALTASALTGCDGCHNPPPPRPETFLDEEQAAYVEEETEPPDPDAPPPPAIAEMPVRPHRRDDRDRARAPLSPALHPDSAWANDEPVTAHRYVYRLRMAVPGGLGTSRGRVTLPAAELYVDVAHQRARARFAGSGWPVAAGSEVRLRRDRPGVYLFDGRGGRPLEPGALSAWFEGGEVSRRGPPLRIFGRYGFGRHPQPANDEVVPGELVCALLAEWAGEHRDGVVRRCELGAPMLWRVGFWRAEQTASVPLQLPRSALRADEGGRPGRIQGGTGRAFLEPEALRRIQPDGPPEGEPVEDAPMDGLRVHNESATRVIVTAEGVALGWVDAGASISFVGLLPGMYEVGSIRPLGAVVQRGRLVRVPGVHRVCDGRCPRTRP